MKKGEDDRVVRRIRRSTIFYLLHFATLWQSLLIKAEVGVWLAARDSCRVSIFAHQTRRLLKRELCMHAYEYAEMGDIVRDRVLIKRV